MAAVEGVSVSAFDVQGWCAQLAGTLDYLLEHRDEEGAWVIAREVIKKYDDAIARAATVLEKRDNVIPIRPFSINTIIDDLGFKT